MAFSGSQKTSRRVYGILVAPHLFSAKTAAMIVTVVRFTGEAVALATLAGEAMAQASFTGEAIALPELDNQQFSHRNTRQPPKPLNGLLATSSTHLCLSRG